MFAILFKFILLDTVSTKQLTFVLLITASVFLIFIAFAVIKTFKLKAQNKRMTGRTAFKPEVEES